ncbi:hypothetical protein BC831DRAFT_441834, partial [Entophlyctis helioformis]
TCTSGAVSHRTPSCSRHCLCLRTCQRTTVCQAMRLASCRSAKLNRKDRRVHWRT